MVVELKKQIGIRVRAARRQRGLTQEQLAERVERTVAAISNIERGSSLPTLATLDTIARRLEVPLRDLFEETRNGRGRLETEMRLKSLLSTLNDEEAEIALRHVELVSDHAQARKGSSVNMPRRSRK